MKNIKVNYSPQLNDSIYDKLAELQLKLINSGYIYEGQEPIIEVTDSYFVLRVSKVDENLKQLLAPYGIMVFSSDEVSAPEVKPDKVYVVAIKSGTYKSMDLDPSEVINKLIDLTKDQFVVVLVTNDFEEFTKFKKEDKEVIRKYQFIPKK